MKVSELCKMVQDSIHSGKYSLEDNQRDWTVFYDTGKTEELIEHKLSLSN